MEVQPFGPSLGFGAEVRGVDLSTAPLSDVQTAKIRHWMVQYGLLVFRNQQLAVSEEVEVARMFEYDRRAGPERLHGLCEH